MVWRRGRKKEHEKELDELKRLRQENEVLTKKVHKLEKKLSHLQKDLEKEHQKRVASTEGTVSTAEGYVYEAGEKTIYDCIVEAKSLELDMSVINDKLSSMDGRQFVAWYETYKEENSE